MKRTTQACRLRTMFVTRPKEWIGLPEILQMGIAQYNARIFDLRKSGMTILNRTETVCGEVRSWFMYEPKEKQQNFLDKQDDL